MTYRVVPHAAARAQLGGFPSDALDALFERLAKVADDPWDAMPVSGLGPEYRQAAFGGAGLISFFVDEATEVITVFDVIWTG